jgi:glycosyltransferase involved in cell wall biosynthesis
MSNPPKLAIWIPSVPEEMGGARVLIDSLVSALGVRRAFVIYLLCGERQIYNDIKNSVNSEEINVSYFPIGLKRNVISIFFEFMYQLFYKFLHPFNKVDFNSIYSKTMERKINRIGIDVIWSPTPDFVAMDIIYIWSVFTFSYLSLPYVPEIHSKGKWKEKHLKYIELIGRASHVVVSNNYTSDLILKHFPIIEKKVSVIPFPTPRIIKEVENSSNIPNCNFFVFPAQFWSHKNHFIVIKAVRELVDNGLTDFKIVLTGADKGNKKYVIKLISDYGLDSFFDIRGFVSRVELESLIKKSLAILAPTLIGPDGLPHLESFQNNIDILISDTMDSSKYWRNFDNVITINPYNSLDWAEIMKSYLVTVLDKNSNTTKHRDESNIISESAYISKIFDIVDGLLLHRKLWS